MKVTIADVTASMQRVLTTKGFGKADMDFIIAMYLGGELRGHTSHGLASFPSFAKQDFSSLQEPVVLQDTHALWMVDAKSNPGTIVGRRAANEAIKRAKAEVTGTAMIKNVDSWLRPGAIAEYIADQGFMAVVMNCGGGAVVAPPGGYQGVAGTNPIAYGVPTTDGPLVVDMATSKQAWGQVRLANKYGTDLPEGSFYGADGAVTVDPTKAAAVKSFGEYKGFALAFLVEVMCGSMMGMDMMRDASSGHKFGQQTPERAAIILVIDPAQTTDPAQFKAANTEYMQKIKTTAPLPGQTIRIPGDAAMQRNTAAIEAGVIEIPNELWQEIQSL